MPQQPASSPPQRPCRKGTTLISAHIKTRAVEAFRSLLLRLSVERDYRVTMQQAVCESLVDFFVQHDEPPPSELVTAVEPTTIIPRSQAARIASAWAELKRHVANEVTNPSSSREDTTMVSAYIKTPAGEAFRSLLLRLSLQRGYRVTTQQAVCESLVDYFIKHQEPPPPELVAAALPSKAKEKLETLERA